MKLYELVYDNYIIIEDNNIIESSLKDVDYQYDNQHIFTFSNNNKIHIVYITSSDIDVKYIINTNSNIELVETRILKDSVKYNRQIILNDNSNLTLYNENNSNTNKLLTFNDNVSLYQDATCIVGYEELTDDSIEAKYYYDLLSKGANVHLRLASQARNNSKKHYHVEIVHNAINTTGIMDNYGVVYDNSSLVIDGVGRITKGQHESASHQTNKIIVFDEHSKAKANPYLYIDEYDVKASHAAAVGKMDEEHLFYLQSRGLTKKEAMQLITYGYLRPVSELIDSDIIKERFEEMLIKVGEYNV